jgi:hypothetical protein
MQARIYQLSSVSQLYTLPMLHWPFLGREHRNQITNQLTLAIFISTINHGKLVHKLLLGNYFKGVFT